MSSIVAWLHWNACFFCVRRLLNSFTPVDSFHRRASSCLRRSLIRPGRFLLNFALSRGSYLDWGGNSTLGDYSVIFARPKDRPFSYLLLLFVVIRGNLLG